MSHHAIDAPDGTDAQHTLASDHIEDSTDPVSAVFGVVGYKYEFQCEDSH